MLVEFLKSYKDELVSEKATVEEGLEAIRTRLLESEKFLDLIKEETAEVFTDFTPRNINSKNHERIKETEAEIADYREQIEAMMGRIEAIDSRLDDTSQAILEAESFRSRSSKDVSISKDQLMNILSYIVADPMRAKIELEQFL